MMIKKFLNSVGLCLGDEVEIQIPQKHIDYRVRDLEKLKSHRDFLKSIEADENSRLTTIENKTSQLVSQTALIFALLTLFIPIIIDKIELVYLRAAFLFLLFFVFTFYLLTIHNAAKNYNVKNFIYGRSSPEEVENYKDKTNIQFLANDIKNLLITIPINIETNNKKATNVIYSYNSFRLANILTGVLAFLLCVSLTILPSKSEMGKFAPVIPSVSSP